MSYKTPPILGMAHDASCPIEPASEAMAQLAGLRRGPIFCGRGFVKPRYPDLSTPLRSSSAALPALLYVGLDGAVLASHIEMVLTTV